VAPLREADLAEWSDDALGAEAQRRGLPVGRVLGRAKLIELLSGDEAEEPDELDADSPIGGGPFATAAMAELLARQGRCREAARVCRDVLASRGDPRADALLAKLDRTRGDSDSRAGRGAVGVDVLPADLDEAARRAFDAGARRVLRVVAFGVGPGGVARYDEDVAAARSGVRLLRLPGGARFVTVAVGWAAGDGRFQPLAHAQGAWSPARS
jgi:hypothetical protein